MTGDTNSFWLIILKVSSRGGPVVGQMYVYTANGWVAHDNGLCRCNVDRQDSYQGSRPGGPSSSIFLRWRPWLGVRQVVYYLCIWQHQWPTRSWRPCGRSPLLKSLQQKVGRSSLYIIQKRKRQIIPHDHHDRRLVSTCKLDFVSERNVGGIIRQYTINSKT